VQLRFESRVYTVSDLIFFGYENGTDIAAAGERFQLESDEVGAIQVSSGTYDVSGSEPFSVLTGDPFSFPTSGYYATDQNGFPVSTELKTFVPGPAEGLAAKQKLFVFGYQEDTDVTVRDLFSGEVIDQATIGRGDHLEFASTEISPEGRFVVVTADKPVSALTHYDQGYYVPARSGTFTGTEFYTYASEIATGGKGHEVVVNAFSDDTSVEIRNSTSGELLSSGTIDAGEVYVETVTGGTDLSVTTSARATVSVQPYRQFTDSVFGYRHSLYVPSASGSFIGTEFIEASTPTDRMLVFGYEESTTVTVQRDDREPVEYTLGRGDAIDVSEGGGVYRITSDNPISVETGYSSTNEEGELAGASAEFAPVRFGSINDPGSGGPPLDGADTSDLTAGTDRLDFGDVPTEGSATRTVTVRNNGSSTLSVREFRIEGPGSDQFEVTNRGEESSSIDPDRPPGFVLEPGETGNVTVQFAPDRLGTATATLVVAGPESDTDNVTVELDGRGVPTVTVTDAEFGRVATNGTATRTVTVRNAGSEAVSLTGELEGADAGSFSVANATGSLGAGESRELTVRFAPNATGEAAAALSLRAAAGPVSTTATARLEGTGALPGARIRVSPARVSFLNVSVGDVASRTITVENAGTRPLSVDRPAIIGINASAFEVVGFQVGGSAARPPVTGAAAPARQAQQPGGFVLQPGGSREVTVRFRAPDDGVRTAARLRFPTNDTTTPQLDVSLSDSPTQVAVDDVQTTGDRETVTVRVTNAVAGERIGVDLSRPATEDSRVAVDRLTFTPLRGGNFTVTVRNSPTPFATTPPFELADGTRPAGFFRINTTLADDEVRDVAIRFRLSRAALSELDGDPEDVALYRFVDRYVELPTDPVEETESHLILRALSPGFSDFGAGVKQAQFEIADARVTLTRIGTGEATEVIVRVRNTGGADGTFTVRLQQEEQVVARRELTIAPDGTRQTTFDRSFGSPGTYRLFVNDRFVANVTVQGETTTAGGDDRTTTDGQPGMHVGAALAALLAAAYALVRRRR
jgi:PGF-CTERM protein